MRLGLVFLNTVSSALISQRNVTTEFEAFWEPLEYGDAENVCKEKGMDHTVWCWQRLTPKTRNRAKKSLTTFNVSPEKKV